MPSIDNRNDIQLFLLYLISSEIISKIVCYRKHERARLLFRNKMFTDIVKTTLLFCCSGVILNKTHAYKRIMASQYNNKVNPNQESRYCDIKTHVCDPVGIGLIQTFENISDRNSCHRLCDNESKCKFTTFTSFRKEPRCFILSDCDRQVNCPKRK